MDKLAVDNSLYYTYGYPYTLWIGGNKTFNLIILPTTMACIGSDQKDTVKQDSNRCDSSCQTSKFQPYVLNAKFGLLRNH